LIVGLLPGKDKRAARSRAIVTFSALVGAMSLARTVSDEALSHDLKTVGRPSERIPPESDQASRLQCSGSRSDLPSAAVNEQFDKRGAEFGSAIIRQRLLTPTALS